MKLPTLKPLVGPAGIGQKIDLRQNLVAEKKELQSLLEAFEAQINEVETQLLQQLDKEGTTNGGGKNATVSVVESIVPNVKDWDSFYKFIARMKYFHLLERRASVSGCRELFETKGAIPGVEPFTKRRLNFSSKKG